VNLWDRRHTAFLFGFFGGLAVNILRLYLVAQSPRSERPELDWIYWTQFIGLAVLGGVLALAHDLSTQISPLVSLNVGLSIPALAKTVAEPQAPKRRKSN
jgi:hypothetical protein